MNLIELLRSSDAYPLDRLVKEIYVAKDQQIYQPGQQTNSIYEVVSGAVKLGSYGSQGQDITYDILSAPDTFGNLKYLNGQFFEFAKTIIPCHLRVYPLDFFRKIIVEDPAVSEWFNKNAVRRWSIAEARLFSIRSASSIERLQVIYNDFDREIVDSENRKHHLFSLLTKQEIGDLTGMTRQTVSQVIKKITPARRQRTA